MFDIDQSIIGDVDVNLAAALLMGGVLIMTLWRSRSGKKADTIFLFMVIAAFVEAVAGLVIAFFEGPESPGSLALVVSIETILELSITIQLFFLLLYVFLTIHDNRDYLIRRMKFYMIPFVILIVLSIVNIFTGIIWYYDGNKMYHEMGLYTVYNLIRYLYLILAIYQYARYRKENGQARFFSIWFYLVPILWGTILERVTPISGFILGNAIANVILFIMISQKVGFTDEGSGFFNIRYLKLLSEKIKAGEYEPHLLIRYHLPEKKDLSDFFRMLKEILPDQCDTVKLDDTNCITVIYGDTRGLINMLSEDIRMISEELCLDIEFDYVVKQRDETPVKFFEKNVVIGG